MDVLRPVILAACAGWNASRSVFGLGMGSIPTKKPAIIEVSSFFNIIATLNQELTSVMRRGARRIRDVPPEILAALSSGAVETVNLMEWLAADMTALARAVAVQVSSRRLSEALLSAADRMKGRTITERLMFAGSAIASAVSSFDGRSFTQLAVHQSDLVRQWACYAVNDPAVGLPLDDRLRRTVQFASDGNMSVREAAWMAFRPHLIKSLEPALPLLEKISEFGQPNQRRFAVEVTRPRSVWGVHIRALKYDPSLAEPLLEKVRADESRYVQLAVGNWLNDASKSRPDWVAGLCRRWTRTDNERTAFIVKRGLRTLRRQQAEPESIQSLLFSERLDSLETMGETPC